MPQLILARAGDRTSNLLRLSDNVDSKLDRLRVGKVWFCQLIIIIKFYFDTFL